MRCTSCGAPIPPGQGLGFSAPAEQWKDRSSPRPLTIVPTCLGCMGDVFARKGKLMRYLDRWMRRLRLHLQRWLDVPELATKCQHEPVKITFHQDWEGGIVSACHGVTALYSIASEDYPSHYEVDGVPADVTVCVCRKCGEIYGEITWKPKRW